MHKHFQQRLIPNAFRSAISRALARSGAGVDFSNQLGTSVFLVRIRRSLLQKPAPLSTGPPFCFGVFVTENWWR
jgi:hypothetical protein